MKTTIKTFALVCALVFGTAATAQNTTIGVVGGYQATSYEAFDLNNAYNGWNVGLTGIYSSMEHWGFGADLIYSRSGGTYQQMDPDRLAVGIYRVQTDNIRLTPKVHYFFGDLGDDFRPTIFAGPSVGYVAGAENISNTPNWSNDFNPINVGGLLGAGAHYQIMPGFWLQGNVSYLVGISPLNSEPVLEPDNLRSNNLSFNVGLAYSLDRAVDKVQ